MQTIAVANQKGGCGKTTTSVNLAACLAEKNYNVLLIDMDPQSQATIALKSETDKKHITIFDILLDEPTYYSIKESGVKITKGLTLLPSRVFSISDEVHLMTYPNRLYKLRSILSNNQLNYDFAIIDCPPSLGILTYNALLASDIALLAVETSFLALHGVSKILEAIEDIKNRYNHPIKIYALATMFDRRTSFSREVFNDMKEYFDGCLLKTFIRNNVYLKEAVSFGAPIGMYKRKSNGYQDYNALSLEMLRLLKLPNKKKVKKATLLKNGKKRRKNHEMTVTL